MVFPIGAQIWELAADHLDRLPGKSLIDRLVHETCVTLDPISMSGSLNKVLVLLLTRILAPLAPMSHSKVENGEAMRPMGMLTTSNPVQSWEVVALKVPISRSRPSSLLIKNMPPITKMMSKSRSQLVSRA